MTSLKFYVLCNKNLHCVKRHGKIIPKEDLVFVINSLNEQFVEKAVNFLKSEGFEYSVTKSDGTAATGKNSVLELFQKSENTHAVMIDGDDFLTPHGVLTYKKIVESTPDIDVLALEAQYGLIPAASNFNDNFTLDVREEVNPEDVSPSGGRLFYRPKDFWQTVEWGQYCIKYISPRENHLRVVLISKKAAEMYRFDPKFKIGEDTLMYLNYKAEFVKKNLNMRHLFDVYPTYVYDTRVGGLSMTESSTFEWVRVLVDEYKRRESEGLMYENTVPRIKVKYEEDYAPDVGSLPNLELPEPEWGDNMNEEYVKKLVDVLTGQRNHAQSVVAELETQLAMVNAEVNMLREKIKFNEAKAKEDKKSEE